MQIKAFLLTASLVAPVALRAQQALPSADSIRLGVSRVFAAYTASDGPGCSIGVAKDGRVLHQAGYGIANLETMTPNTAGSVFHLASVSKQFTAASIVLLARDGKLSLDDDIRKHLPEIPDYGHRITIRQLLLHTSGLRDQWDLLSMARGRFEENRITESDVLEIVSRQKALNFTPGSEYLYSNTGYTLAGTIVRRVSGKSLRDFAEERIFRPLGMTATQFQDDYTRIIANRSAGYVRRPQGGWRVGLPNFDVYGATSLFSNVGDMLKWQANIARSNGVGDSAMFRDMTAFITLTNGDTSSYGLGIQTSLHRGARVVGHGGADAGYRTWVGRFPEYGLEMAVLCNASNSNPQGLAYGVADLFLPRTLAGRPVPPMPERVAADRALLATLPGVYVDELTGANAIVSLRGDSVLVAGPANGPELVPVGPRRFRLPGQPSEYEFLADGTMRQTLLIAWPPVTLPARRRYPVWTPTATELAAFAGTYRSEELGATYTVAVRDSTLVMTTRWGTDAIFRPVYQDAFGGQFVARFSRKGGKANAPVDGMTWYSGRVRGVKFVRVKEPVR